MKLFAAVMVTAFAVGVLVQVLSLAIAAKALRLPNAALSRACRVAAILMVINLGISGVAGALVTLGLPEAGVALLEILASVSAFVVVINRAYWSTIGRALGACGLTLVASLLFVLPLRAFVLQAFRIPVGSMLPALDIGDHVLVSKYAYRVSKPERGDLIIFVYP